MVTYAEALQACQAQTFNGLAGTGYPVSFNRCASTGWRALLRRRLFNQWRRRGLL
jgi:hypothetical protein